MIKNIIATLLVCVAAFSQVAFSESNNYKNLLNNLYDTRHMVRSGIDLKTYTDQVNKVNIHYGRFLRDKGIDNVEHALRLYSKNKITDEHMVVISASYGYVIALDAWRKEYGQIGNDDKFKLNEFNRITGEALQKADDVLTLLEKKSKKRTK